MPVRKTLCVLNAKQKHKSGNLGKPNLVTVFQLVLGKMGKIRSEIRKIWCKNHFTACQFLKLEWRKRREQNLVIIFSLFWSSLQNRLIKEKSFGLKTISFGVRS